MAFRMAQQRSSRNLGATSIRRKNRSGNPMRDYDALPVPLRMWLSNAALPWSPASARRIWSKAYKEGQSIESTLQKLDLAEAKTLARDRFSTSSQFTQKT